MSALATAVVALLLNGDGTLPAPPTPLPLAGATVQSADGLGQVSQSPKVSTVSADGKPGAVSATARTTGSSPYSCSYEPDPGFSPPAWDTADQHPEGNGAWYLWRCAGDTSSLNMAYVPNMGLETWLPNGSPSSPASVALQAVKKLPLPSPIIGSSPGPGAMQWVRFPTWLWVDAAAWKPLSATASVPGMTVMATATPVAVSWSMGDGTNVTCNDPGTPYSTAYSASTSSSDCGHTYRKASTDEPGGVYRVTATIQWRVTWSGGGSSGVLPGMATTSSIAVRVAESQALVTSAH